MSVFNLYSKRQKALKGQSPDVYRHDDLPIPLRYQIVHIWDEVIGLEDRCFGGPTLLFTEIYKVLCKEYGVMQLMESARSSLRQEVAEFFLNCREVDKCLDVIQVTFTLIPLIERRHPDTFHVVYVSMDEAINELNARFKEHGIGFQYFQGQILRIDSEFTHQEITVPALNLLQQPHLHLASQEFLAAHEHHRHGRYKECLNECLKAFESTMKAICHKRKWAYNQNDTAKALIEICEKNGLFPVFMQNHLTGLRMTLESGVPTARNKTSGHGQGVTPITVSEQFAAYVLHLTAANIRFLAESERAMK